MSKKSPKETLRIEPLNQIHRKPPVFRKTALGPSTTVIVRRINSSALPFSLSQRERAGVRENRTNGNVAPSRCDVLGRNVCGGKSDHARLRRSTRRGRRWQRHLPCTPSLPSNTEHRTSNDRIIQRSAFDVRRSTFLLVLLGALLFSGCQTYHSRPLPTTPDLLRSPAITVPANQFNLPGLEPHPFSTNGLDEMAVVTLAVFNNPDLKAARLQAGVADAQLVEAGLLPDPQIGAGIAKSPRFIGYNVNLSEDIQALITRGAAKASAKAHAHQVNLDILWQEYQVAAKAEQLFIQLRADGELQTILTSSRNLLSDRYREDEASFRQGNIPADTASADFAALMDAERNLGQNELDSNQTRHDINQLLGLQPDVRLQLIGRHKTQSITPDQFQSAVAAISRRRADLLALQAGYQSQEESLREAVLAQFPSMSAGVEPARDPVEGVSTIGLNVNLTLPLFNRNQGQIAIQRATRAQLYQTYQARLDQAVNDASRVWNATQIMARQLQNIETSLPALEKKTIAAAQQFQQGNLDAGTYTTMEMNLATEQAEAIRLRAFQEQAKADLQILLGLPLNNGAM